MQLKLSRSQREGGILTKNAIFCLDARVQLNAREATEVSRYKLGSQVIYNSEAAKRQLAKGDAVADGSFTGDLKRIGFNVLAALNLNITIDSLQRGQHIECKDLSELLGAEEAIMDACKHLRAFLETAATFDGRDVIIDFTTETPTISTSPVAPAPLSLLPPAPSAASDASTAGATTMNAAFASYEPNEAAEPNVLQDAFNWFATGTPLQKGVVLGGGAIIVVYILSHL